MYFLVIFFFVFWIIIKKWTVILTICLLIKKLIQTHAQVTGRCPGNYKHTHAHRDIHCRSAIQKTPEIIRYKTRSHVHFLNSLEHILMLDYISEKFISTVYHFLFMNIYLLCIVMMWKCPLTKFLNVYKFVSNTCIIILISRIYVDKLGQF